MGGRVTSILSADLSDLNEPNRSGRGLGLPARVRPETRDGWLVLDPGQGTSMRSLVMADHAAFENETRDRLNRMERELRYWRLGGILALSLATVAVAVAMADPPAKELRVETLRIVERSGKDRIVLTAVPAIPDMTFLDPDGQSRLTLDITDDHKPELRVSEFGKGKGRLTLGIEDGSPILQLYDRDGTKRVTLGVPKDTGALIRTFDANGKLQGRFP